MENIECNLVETTINAIFLDIDGVLNGYNFWNILGWNIVCKLNNKKLKGWYRNITQPFGIHKRKVKRLAKIVHKTNAKIVISSSWRTGLQSNNLSDEEVKLLNLFKKYKIDIYDYTPVLDSNSRCNEIVAWIMRNVSCDEFIILDDEKHDFDRCPSLSERFIQTSVMKKSRFIKNYWYEDAGLKNKHVKEAIRLLKRKVEECV